MFNKKNIFYKPVFKSKEDEIDYLKRKISFLLDHSEKLADRSSKISCDHNISQLKELQDIKNSRSWRITLPLREASRLLKMIRNRYNKNDRL